MKKDITAHGIKKGESRLCSRILLSLLVFVGMLCFFSADWYGGIFSDVGFEAIFYTLLAGTGSVQGELLLNWVINGLLPAVLVSAAADFLLFFLPKAVVKKLKIPRIINTCTAVLLTLVMVILATNEAEMLTWIGGRLSHTEIYSEAYTDPEKVKVTFPEKKRNLVYIYLESMENTFLSSDYGGGFEETIIPELFSLAEENVNFSSNKTVGGGHTLFGSTWTAGAMVAQGAGIPLRTTCDFNLKTMSNSYSSFLPGAVTINDILHNNGYKQAFLCGSDSSYGGRKQFFSQHGVDYIYDWKTAAQEGEIPEDYQVWWGMEDSKVFDYAKKKLTKLSQGSEPFAFTMLTSDTHHIGGYSCDKCENEFPQQYENVYACSSRQVAEFVKWLEDQPFFSNTTVVITGDHCSMDGGFFKKNVRKNYDRTVYNCFINSAADAVNSKEREFSTMDMFPTTLAAMGCGIEGEALGFGTNLFSGKKTLSESYGEKKLSSELGKSSAYYSDVLEKGKK